MDGSFDGEMLNFFFFFKFLTEYAVTIFVQVWKVFPKLLGQMEVS